MCVANDDSVGDDENPSRLRCEPAKECVDALLHLVPAFRRPRNHAKRERTGVKMKRMALAGLKLGEADVHHQRRSGCEESGGGSAATIGRRDNELVGLGDDCVEGLFQRWVGCAMTALLQMTNNVMRLFHFELRHGLHTSTLFKKSS